MRRRARAGARPARRAGCRSTGRRRPRRRRAHARCRPRLRTLEHALDAVGDALTAEGVYQAVRGNPTRASASVDALAHGESQPPELEFVATPRTGAAVTHRLLRRVLRDAGPAPLPACAAPRAVGRAGARAVAAPAARRPAPRRLPRRVRRRDRQGRCCGATRQPLGTLVAVAARRALPERGVAAGAKSQLEQLIEYALWRGAPATIPADATLRLLLGRGPPRPAGDVAQPDRVPRARCARSARRSCRRARARRRPTWRCRGERRGRRRTRPSCARARTRRWRRCGAPATALAAPDDVRERLADFALLRLPGGDPGRARTARRAGGGDAGRGRPAARGRGAMTSTARRRARGAACAAGASAQAFRALPLVRPANLAELGNSFRRSDELQGGDPLQALSWLQGAGRVRAGASRLDAALIVRRRARPRAGAGAQGRAAAVRRRRALDRPASGDAAARQGLARRAPAAAVPGHRAAVRAGASTSGSRSCPRPRSRPGVAFNYDAPGARPPQSVLLAVAPPGAARWEVETIEKTLLETFELAKLRAVDPQALGGDVLLQRALPALYVSDQPGRRARSRPTSRGWLAMSSITFWTRLEPYTRLDDIEDGLQARAARPAVAARAPVADGRVRRPRTPARRCRRACGWSARRSSRFQRARRRRPSRTAPEVPLEALVEREPVQSRRPARAAARRGRADVPAHARRARAWRPRRSTAFAGRVRARAAGRRRRRRRRRVPVDHGRARAGRLHASTTRSSPPPARCPPRPAVPAADAPKVDCRPAPRTGRGTRRATARRRRHGLGLPSTSSTRSRLGAPTDGGELVLTARGVPGRRRSTGTRSTRRGRTLGFPVPVDSRTETVVRTVHARARALPGHGRRPLVAVRGRAREPQPHRGRPGRAAAAAARRLLAAVLATTGSSCRSTLAPGGVFRLQTR